MKKINLKLFFSILSLVTVILISNCKKKDDSSGASEDSDGQASYAEQALEEASGQASSSEGSGNISSSEFNTAENLMNYVDPKNNKVFQQSACNYVTARTCSSGTGTLDWNGCTIGTSVSVTMTGGWTETWANQASCTNGFLADTQSVSRVSTGATATFASGAKIVTDTKGGTAYDGTTVASGAVVTTRSGTSRTVSMNPSTAGVHRVGTGPLGRTIFDYFTVPSLTISGTRSNGSTNGLSSQRTISGTVKVYHNVLKYTATNTFNSVKWTDSTCCFPTSGSISSSFTGSGAPSSVNTTLTFGSTCGSATLTSENDTTGTTVTLTNCQ